LRGGEFSPRIEAPEGAGTQLTAGRYRRDQLKQAPP
jgi:hypothetical protein